MGPFPIDFFFTFETQVSNVSFSLLNSSSNISIYFQTQVSNDFIH